MPEREPDDVADALAALAGGEVPSAHETPSSGIPSESTVFSTRGTDPAADPDTDPAVGPSVDSSAISPSSMMPPPPVLPPTAASLRPLPQARSEASKRSPAPRPARSGAPVVPPTAPGATPFTRPVPVAPPPSAATDSDATSERSSHPPRRSAAPERRAAPAQIAVPTPAPELDQPDFEASADFVDIEELEMDAPAPDLSSLVRGPSGKRKAARGSLSSNLFFRRTLIPILLTNGLMLPALGIWTLVDRNAPLQETGKSFLITLIVVGFVLLVLAVLNMLHVRQILRSRSNGPKSA